MCKQTMKEILIVCVLLLFLLVVLYVRFYDEDMHVIDYVVSVNISESANKTK